MGFSKFGRSISALDSGQVLLNRPIVEKVEGFVGTGGEILRRRKNNLNDQIARGKRGDYLVYI